MNGATKKAAQTRLTTRTKVMRQEKTDKITSLNRAIRLRTTKVNLFISIVITFILSSKESFGMKLVLQRVKSASVTVDNNIISSIGPGVLALVGLHENDTEENLVECSKKLLAAKLWENENGGQWRHGVKQKNYEVLCVSQFTLYGKLSKKNQPDYKLAMKAIPAEQLYSKFISTLKENYEDDKIFDGKFGAMMDVELVNDGPVTLVVESEPLGGSEAS